MVFGVYGKNPLSLAVIMSSKEKNTRCSFALLRASSAFWLTQTMPRPVGTMKPFCEPLTHASTPHSSMRKSMLATELTPSTNSSAG
ncbi:hypothetical protein D3C83_65210 [compost metagenome]